MKYPYTLTMIFLLIIACKKESIPGTDVRKEAIVSHMSENNCGYLLWVDSSMFKITNESVVYNICEDRLYTSVLVDYELLNSFSSITCEMYTADTRAQQVKIISISKK